MLAGSPFCRLTVPLNLPPKNDMELFTINDDIKVICKNIPTFPIGIKEGFDEMIEHYGMEGREYYGISRMDADFNIIYKVAVKEEVPNEGDQYGYTPFIIEKGQYLSETLLNWMSNTNVIKESFERLMQDPRFDNTYDCIEWYVSDDEVKCLVRITPQQ
jgi:hypothetical protein